MLNGIMTLVQKSLLQENCQTMETFSLKQNSIEPMEMDNRNVRSDAEGNFLIAECSSPKQNALREKHERGNENLLGEPMETRNIESDAPGKCQMVKSSCLNNISLVEEDKTGSEHVSSQPMETTIVGPDPQRNCLPAECSNSLESSIPEINYLGETHVVGMGHVTREQNSLCENHEQLIESFGLKQYSLGKEHELNKPMESRNVGSDVRESSLIEECLSPKQNKLGEKHGLGFEHLRSEPMDGIRIEPDALICQGTESSSLNQVRLVEKHEVGSENIASKPMESKTVGSDSIGVELTPDVATKKNSSRTARKEKSVSSLSRKRKYMLRSSTGSTRILRSRLRSTSKPPNSSNVPVNVSDVRKKKRKRSKMKRTLNDEYSRIRKHLRYLLNRMGYEHSLIDAYSGEGWKGQSLEKIKPEKELQRATSEIFRCKQRIRDLFQHLDSLCAEGRLQESLFDSEGQIYSEDIFCARCGSKDLTAENDIILCDGICDRGFHQMCLEPPLLKEEIPPEDEGWLCPGCDCKVDCIDLLNDFQGTDLSLDDNWEKVFPEAASIVAGDRLDENFGFPSDDSEDNDYDPDGPEVDERTWTEGSTSEESEGSTSKESDFTSASDELRAMPMGEQYLGLPSDDSEDDDYDPDAPDLDVNVNKESSSSDFTSDPETFSASSCDNGTSGGDEDPTPSPVNGGKWVAGVGQRRTKGARNNKHLLNAELLSLQEPDYQGPLSSVSGKRHIERLDYKKLHDETYGNVPSDSSDDEDWADLDTENKRKNNEIKRESGKSPEGTLLTDGREAVTRGGQQNSKRTKDILKRRTRQKLTLEDANNSAVETNKDGSLPDCIGKKASSLGSRRLGNSVTERLLESLRENEYPKRDTKETLAKELGITVKQVSKWFENARWSLRHPAKDDACKGVKASPSKESTPQKQVRNPKIRNKRNIKSDDQNQTTMVTSNAKNTQREETSADPPKSEAAQTRSQNENQEGSRSRIQMRRHRKVLS